LAKEISQRRSEIEDIEAMLDERNTLLEVKRKDYKELTDSVENSKNDYVQVNMLPNQLMKENDKIISEQEYHIQLKKLII
jgi:hypothetical protein